MANQKLRVLYGEGDAEVLASQAVLIQNAGHQVETATGRKGVEDSLKGKTFDLVVLGPTLTKNDRHHLPYMVKKANQGTKVLVMHTDGERHHAVDAHVDTGLSMAHVIAKIDALTIGGAAQDGRGKAAVAGK